MRKVCVPNANWEGGAQSSVEIPLKGAHAATDPLLNPSAFEERREDFLAFEELARDFAGG